MDLLDPKARPTLTSSGRRGSNLVCEGKKSRLVSPDLCGELPGLVSGGRDKNLRDLRGAKDFREDFGLTGEGRAGDEDSAPDWKILLSSHPLSSFSIETRRDSEPAAPDWTD